MWERARATAAGLRAAAERMDRRNAFSWEAYRRLAEAGLLAMLTPNGEHPPASALAYVAAAEELGRVSAALANLVQLTTVAGVFLRRYAALEQSAPLIERMAGGTALCAVAMTEAEAGSDAAGIQSTARRKGDGYLLTGEKRFVTGARVASHAIVTAKIQAGRRRGKVSTFLVALAAPGVVVGPPDDLLGSRGLGTATVRFEAVELPDDACLGEAEKGLEQILSVIDIGRLGIAGLAVGLAGAAVELAITRASRRQQFGVPIASHQGIQFLLAEMYAQSAAARAVTYGAAARCDEGAPFTLQASVAKYLASEAAVRCATDAVQIYGGDGYRRGMLVERIYRDAKGTQIYEGTNQIQRLAIARAILRGG